MNHKLLRVGELEQLSNLSYQRPGDTFERKCRHSCHLITEELP